MRFLNKIQFVGLSLGLFSSVTNSLSVIDPNKIPGKVNEISTRREALLVAAAGFMSPIVWSNAANAFDNKISNKYDDRPKRRGPQPNDLGVRDRTTVDGLDFYPGLKPCKASPNCFCSTMTVEDDPDHSIPPWTWPESKASKEEAFEELKEVIAAYKPGQNGVDGGGFQIQKFDASKGYLYVQFEALKNGYIDDFEAAYIPGAPVGGERAVQIRSSSRVGYLDYAVNAKRLNYIAEKLREKGWDAVGVDPKVHRGYFLENADR